MALPLHINQSENILEEIQKEIHSAGQALRGLLEELEVVHKGFTQQQYANYLRMQYHLTDGVQKHFFRLMGNPKFKSKKKFRDFLYRFGLEEEPHYLIAKKDLENLGEGVGECPLDVELWWSYFNERVDEKPFLRLGATCILENISGDAVDLIDQAMANSSFLNKQNTRFVIIHKHEELPHGDQILEALDLLSLTDQDKADLLRGAQIGKTLFMRALESALKE